MGTTSPTHTMQHGTDLWQRLHLGHQGVRFGNVGHKKYRDKVGHLTFKSLPADMDAEKEHRRQRRQAIKTQKALTEPPRLGKLKYEKAPVQVSRNPCSSTRDLC